MTSRPINLTKRYNKDGSISLLGWKGRVVCREKDYRSVEAFIRGWYGERPVTLNRPQFSKAIEAR